MSKYIDLTGYMEDGDPTMAMDPKLSISWHCNLDNLGYNLSRVTTSTHQGTHIDAPKHFFYEGKTIDEIPLEKLILKGIKIDLTAKKDKEDITPADLEPYADKIEKGMAVILDTGWEKNWPQPKYFSDFPKVTDELAEWLVKKEIGMIAMAMPTPNPINWKSVHETLLGAEVLVVEGLANLAELPAEGFTFYAMPLKLKGRDGSPIRAFAITD